MKLLPKKYIWLAIACVGAPSIASANDQATIDGVLSTWSDPKGLDTLRHLAACTVERHADAAQVFIRNVGDDAYLLKSRETLFNDKCIKSYWFKISVTSISSYVYTPLLAELLLTRNYEAATLPDVSNVGRLDHPALPAVDIESVHPRFREMFTIDKATSALELVGECVSRADPQAVYHLAQAVPASMDESNRLAALKPVISTCGGEKLTVTFPAFVWRGAFVMNLYRLVDAARPVELNKVVPNA